MEEEKREIGLIVAADEPALFFSSSEAAAMKLEAIDVKNGVYTSAWDPLGRPHRIRAMGNRVVIELDNRSQPDPEGLRRVLLSFCSAAGIGSDPTDSNWALLNRCRPFVVD